MPVGVDIFQHNGSELQVSGSVAQRLLSNNMNPTTLRTNALLRKDEWIMLDTAVVRVARERLAGVADLMSRGLSMSVPNALGTMVVQHQTQGDTIAAEVSMDGVTRGNFDNLQYDLVNTPLPIVHRDFQLTLRHLEASRRNGIPLDTANVEAATREVVNKLEDILFNGLSANHILGFGSSSAQVYGYTTRTGRNTVTLAQNWNASGKTGQEILDDVLSMISAAQADRMYGPYMLYVPTAYWVPLSDDFKANSDKTILQRLKEIPGIIDVKPADRLTANNVVLVQLTSDVVDMIDGIQPMVVQWEEQGGMVLNFKVMAIMVPRIKIDAEGHCGVVHLS